MAPQQNSTLIEDDILAFDCVGGNSTKKFSSNLPTLHDNVDEEEIIRRCSPILAPTTNELRKLETDENCRDCNLNTNYAQMNEFQKFENHIKNCRCHLRNKNFCAPNPNSGYSRRSRSVSLKGASDAIESGHKEIPIWIENEPRYVSGVTYKTTCNDIIQALIDDEIQNGNYAYCKNIKQHKSKKDGGDSVGATSRDYSDYVITECWRGIERSYDGNMTILPVWKAWSRVHNEIRLTLRNRNELREIVELKGHRKSKNFLQKYFNKLTHFWRKDKTVDAVKLKAALKQKESCLLAKTAAIPDEFLFVILPDKLYEKQTHKSDKVIRKQLHPIKEEINSPEILLHDKIIEPKEKKVGKQKERKNKKYRRCHDNQNCIRRRKNSSPGEKLRNSVRYKLAKKTSEMDELYKREYALTRQLNEKCKLYRLQNQIYSNPEQQWNISIGQVQRKIESYAKEIVRTEHELLELKNEIKQDMSLINNLKRLTLERNKNLETDTPVREQDIKKVPVREQSSIVDTPQSSPATPTRAISSKCNEQMQFVDNIYEFCDNNASVLV